MRLHIICLLIGICLVASAAAQTNDRGIWVGFARKSGRMYGGPDPNNPTHLVDVLKRREFNNYLEVTPEQGANIDEMIRRLPRPTPEIIRSSPDPDVTIAYYESLVNDEIRKTVSDRQYTKLKQLCFRIEIGILGLPNAIAYGTLADAAGVHENQRAHVYERSARFAKEVSEECEFLARRTEEEMIDLLPVEFRTAARDELGPFFEFKYFPRQTSYASMPKDKRRAAEALQLYSSRQVRSELKLTEEQVSGIDELLAKSSKTVSSIARQSDGKRLSGEQLQVVKEAGDAFFTAFDEVFMPSQVRRLDQLILRHRIRCDGHVALLQSLNEKAEKKIDESERAAFLKGCDEISSKTQLAIGKAKARLENRVGEELTIEQRKKFLDAIGDYYEYVPSATRTKNPNAIYPY